MIVYAESMTFACGARLKVEVPDGVTVPDRVFSVFEAWHDSICDCGAEVDDE